ncbi:MAG TPA: cell envelope integrity protein CreD [Usitatibacter sp.]|nr:cell envelope integrity protein CreD [Usitatibacter sp.]
MKIPLLGRIAIVGGIALVLLVPIALIEGKINERRMRAESVEAQFAGETSGAQMVAGPLLALTCEETFVAEREVMRAGKAETISEKKTMPCPTGYFTPNVLRIAGHVPVETRHRGIYTIRLFHASLDVNGEFEWPKPALWNGINPRAWKHAYLVTAVRDARGVKRAESAAGPLMHDAGGNDFGPARFAIREDLGEYRAREADSKLPFAYKLQLLGTSRLDIAPVGDATDIRLTSNWPHPSFTGAWTPDERDVTREGFLATWRTTHLATGGRAAWEAQARDGKLLDMSRAAGVVLFDPVNVYSLSYRATQYAFLFVLFTFAAIALVEVVGRVKLHPMQYLLTGLALAVFFLLLIALSEHIAFGIAYGSAATACVLLVAFYLRHGLGTRLRAAGLGALLAVLYGALFVILKSEDHALLMGSVLVFGVLAIAMIATRKVDWAEVSARMVSLRDPSGGGVGGVRQAPSNSADSPAPGLVA